MPSLFPFALSSPFELSSPEPISPDTIHVTTSFTVNAGDTLDLDGSPGFKLEVKNHASVTLDINGTVNVDGGDRQDIAGILTSQSANGDADVTIGATGSLTVASDAIGAAVAGAIMMVSGSTFANDGTLEVTASKGTAAGAVAEFTTGAGLVNNGLMIVDAKETAYGFFLEDAAGQAVNNDSMLVTGAQAVGIFGPTGGSVVNNGLVRAAGRGVGSFAIGIAMDGGSFTNNGNVHADSKGQTAGVEVIDATAFTNNGHIRAIVHGPAASIGLLFSTDSGGLIVNNGVIIGQHAAMALDVLDGLSAASNDVLINNGNLVGDVMTGGGSDGISNVGRIIGDIDLGDDGDILISNRGHISGAIMGGLGNDNIEASRAGDTLYGDEQDDSLGGGNDVLRGMKGADTLFGGQGVDTLIGGLGSDQLTGGAGDDVFKFTKPGDAVQGSADLITDLVNTDSIDLSRIDADSTTGGDQAFHIVASFTGQAGELTLSYDGVKGLTTISGDTDGDGDADVEVTATGDHHDFVNFML